MSSRERVTWLHSRAEAVCGIASSRRNGLARMQCDGWRLKRSRVVCSEPRAMKEMGMDVFRRAHPSPDGRNEGFFDRPLSLQPSASSISDGPRNRG